MLKATLINYPTNSLTHQLSNYTCCYWPGGQYCFALWRLSSSSVVCCRRLLSSVTLHGGLAGG